MKYPKINSLYKRVDMKNELIIGDYALPEFVNIKQWLVQEKIDGTNIRINYQCEADGGSLSVNGRTDDAQIPKPLMDYISTTFDYCKMYHVFDTASFSYSDIWLFGEGYGPKIQKGGGNYRDDAGFILFDVLVNGIWLNQSSVKDIADKLEIPYAPIIGTMTTEQIVSYVKSKPNSLCSVRSQVLEGIVAKTDPLLLQRNGDPLMFKLKCRDF